MRVKIKSEAVKLYFAVPTRLVLNSLTLKLLLKHGSKVSNVRIGTQTARKLRDIAAAIRRFKRGHRHWVLIEAESAEGNGVEIRL